MKTDELRIGNYVQDIKDFSTHRVEYIGRDRIGLLVDPCKSFYRDESITNISPIPLTGDWLTELGFTETGMLKRHGNGYDYQPEEHWRERLDYVHPLEECFISHEKDFFNGNFDGEYLYLYHSEWYEWGIENKICVGLQHVHQLQNLFYSITKTHLTIKTQL